MTILEQMSLLEESSDKKLKFYGSYRNVDGTIRTIAKKNIVDSFTLYLTKNELKAICREATKIEICGFVYEVYYVEGDQSKEVSVRFDNYRPAKRRSVFEHIDLYFDTVSQCEK